MDVRDFLFGGPKKRVKPGHGEKDKKPLEDEEGRESTIHVRTFAEDCSGDDNS